MTLRFHHLVRHASLRADAFQTLGVFMPPSFFFLVCFIVDQRAPTRLDFSIIVLFGRIPVSLVRRAVLSDHFNLWDKRICRVFGGGTFEESKEFLSQLLELRRFARMHHLSI